MSDLELTAPPAGRPVRRRTRRDPRPRFKADLTGQLDAILGCPSLVVPMDHLARGVQRLVGRLHLGSIEEGYSSLGRHGHAPRNVLAVWVYASLIGLHHATKVARAVKTDAAFRLLSGGHSISRSTLNEFRLRHQALFAACIEQTVAMAQAEGMLAVDNLAADSMRLRAHASTAALRTLSRSTKRLKELAGVDEQTLTAAEITKHRAKVKKHQDAIAECEKRGRTSVVTTNPSAALMKFPEGGALPGHRITAMASGSKARLVVAVLITAHTNDYGSLKPIVDATTGVLARIGLPPDTKLQITADAGYCSQSDLAFAQEVREDIDVLIEGAHRPEFRPQHFPRDRFIVDDEGKAICPAGRAMKGPTPHPQGQLYTGIGCGDCHLRAGCTDGKHRSLYLNVELDRLRLAMQQRMAAPDGRNRYNRRIATVEPVFSHLESTMGFRRASSRREGTVVAEILLKVLAHNLSRLLAAGKLSRVYCLITPQGTLVPLPIEF